MSIYIEEPTFPEATNPCLREVAGAPSPGGEVNADALMAHIMLKEKFRPMHECLSALAPCELPTREPKIL